MGGLSRIVDYVFGGGLEDDIKGLGRTVDDAVRNAVGTIGDTLNNIKKAVEQDPVKAIASAAAIASGQWWALPAVNTVDALLEGESLQDSLMAGAKTAAIQWVTKQIIDYVGDIPEVKEFGQELAAYLDTGGDLADSWTEYVGFENQVGASVPHLEAFANLGSNGLTQTAQSIVNVVAQSAAATITALATNKDPVQALLNTAITGGLGTVINSGAAGTTLQNTPKFVQRALVTAVSAGVLGESMAAAGAGSVVNSLLADLYKEAGKAVVKTYDWVTKPAVEADGSWVTRNPIHTWQINQYTIVSSDPMDRAGYAQDMVQSWISVANRYQKEYEDILKNGYLDIDEIYAWQRKGSVGPPPERVKPYSELVELAKAQYAIATNGSSTVEQARDAANLYTKYVAQANQAAEKLLGVKNNYDIAVSNINTYRGNFESNVSAAVKLDSAVAAEISSYFKTAGEVVDTIVEANGMSLDKIKDVNAVMMNILKTDKPLQSAVDYAVGIDKDFLIKKFDSYGKAPAVDYDYNGMDVLIKDLTNYDEVKAAAPNFNAREYREVNKLGDISNPYAHYITIGRNQDLAVSKADAEWKATVERGRIIQEVADVLKVPASALGPEVIGKIDEALNSRAQGEAPFNKYLIFREATVRNWDDMAGLRVPKTGAIHLSGSGVTYLARSDDETVDRLGSMETQVTNFTDDLRKQYGLPEGYRVGTELEQMAGKGYWITVGGSSRVYLVPDTAVGIPPPLPAELKQQDPLQFATTLSTSAETIFGKTFGRFIGDTFTNLLENAPNLLEQAMKPVQDFNQKMLDAYGTLYNTVTPDSLKESVNTWAGLGGKALASTLNAFNGLVVFAGINPKSTPLGKFSDALEEWSKGVQSNDWKASLAAMDKNLKSAQGFGGVTKAIFGNLWDHPTVFLAEYVGINVAQEIVPFLVGGGVGKFAQGLAVVRGMGAKMAARIGQTAAVSASMVTDIAESAGGAAEQAFKESYEIATKKLGMSEADATQVALNVAAKNGAISGLISGATFGLSGSDLAKVIYQGSSGKGEVASTLGELVRRVRTSEGLKITLKESGTEAVEGTLTQAHLEMELYKLDPNRDVAGNLASAAWMGILAGGGTAGTVHGIARSLNFSSNLMMATPQVQDALQKSTSYADFQFKLNAMGITDAPVIADDASTKFTDIPSYNDINLKLNQREGYTPTDSDVAKVTGLALSKINLDQGITTYVNEDLKTTSPEEVANILALRGFQGANIPNELSALVGTMAEVPAEQAINTYIAQRTVTDTDIQRVFDNLGYKATQQDVDNFRNQSFLQSGDTKLRDDIITDAAEFAVNKMNEARLTNIESTLALLSDPNLSPEESEAITLIVQNNLAPVLNEIDAIQNTVGVQKDLPGAADVNEALKISIGRSPFNAKYDLNGDGRVTSADVTNLMRLAQGQANVPVAANSSWGKPTGLYKEIADTRTALEAAIAKIPVPATITRTEVADIVKTAFTNNPSLKLADVQGVVDAAISKLPTAPTAADITRIVTDTTKNFASKSDIDTAISNIKFPAGITQEQVSGIVSQAFKDNPGLSKADVQGIVDSAVSKLPAAPTLEQINTAIKTATSTFASKSDIDTAISKIKFPEGITQEQVSAIVSQAFKDNPGLSKVDVQGVVDAAIAKIPTAPTLTQIENAIKTATSTFASKSDIDTAIANIQFPAGISKDDVSKIVSDAFKANPGLTKVDVEGVVNAAISKLPAAPTIEQINAAIKTATSTFASKSDIDTAIANIKFPPGISKDDVSKIVSDAFKANPGLSKADVQGVVDAAIAKLPAAPTIEQIRTEIGAATKSFATKSDIETAIAGIKFPQGLTSADVTKAITDYMEANPGLNAKDVTKVITDYMAANPPLSKDDVTKIVSDAGALFKTDLATTEKTILAEVAKNEAAGLKRDDALQKAIADVAATQGKDVAALTKQITDSQSNLGKEILAVSTALATTEKTILAEVAKNEAAGLKRDDALQKAIADVAATQETDVASLTKQITDSQSNLGKEILAVSTTLAATEKSILAEVAKNEAAGLSRDAALQKAISDVAATQGKDVAALTKQITDSQSTLGKEITSLGTAITGVETRLNAAIAAAKAAGQTGDAALQAAINKVATDLGTNKEALLTQIGKSEGQLRTEFATQLGAVKTELGEIETTILGRIDAYEKAGMSRDQALGKAISDVSTQLGTTSSTLAKQLEDAQTNLGREIAGTKTALQGQITEVATILGKPTQAVTQSDIDYVQAILNRGPIQYTPEERAYDVNQDGKIDQTDLSILQPQVTPPAGGAPPPAFAPAAGSRWAPTGVFGKIQETQQALSNQLSQGIATLGQQMRIGQQQANMGSMMNLFSQAGDIRGQQVQVKAPDPARINYVYDFGSIFANPGQEQMFVTPYAEGGSVDDIIDILRS